MRDPSETDEERDARFRAEQMELIRKGARENPMQVVPPAARTPVSDAVHAALGLPRAPLDIAPAPIEARQVTVDDFYA